MKKSNFAPLKKLILTCTAVFTFQSLVFSQVIPEMMLEHDTTLYEKLYLHIDRELYSPGDDIWFKSYLVSGINNRLISGVKNIYVQLIDEDGKIIDQRLMLSFNGVSNNDFHLPDTLPSGQYTIRGYTKFLQNFEEESLFHQKITIASSTDLPDFKDKPQTVKIIDVPFLPEGGSLVMNAHNHIAFKAINEKGKGIPVTGKIIDETGKEITSYKSTFNGMGTFEMIPQEGKKYYAQIDGYPNFSYQFEDARIDGIALHYQQKENYLQFILSRNIKSGSAKNLFLAISHRGEELFREEVEMTGFQHPMEIYKGFFPLGISKITVFDTQNNILAERLVFVRNSDEKTLKITTDKTEYKPREKIELKMESLLNREEDNIKAGLSVAVVHEDYFNGDGRSQTIESYLLLDSELKGSLESPASYFTDEENVSADEKLDLAMMVNGWRKYYWDELEDYFRNQLPNRADAGLTLKGEVQTLLGEKPVKGETVELGPFSSQFLMLRDTTDEWGRFSFNHLYLQDSALLMINAKNKKGKNINAEIFCESIPVFDSNLAVSEIKEINQTSRKIELPEKFNRVTYYRYLAEQEFKLKEGSILIKEVEIKRELISDPIITGVFGFIDRSYTPSDADRKNYPDVQRYLEIEVPNIYVIEDQIRMGAAIIPPRIYVDGYIPSVPLEFVQMNDIAKIEIINPSKISSSFLVYQQENSWVEFGSTTKPGGVISILTKTGFGKFKDDFVRVIPGRTTLRVRGFRQAREFYSPAYPLTEQNLIDKPDQRPTLYWNPFVMLENGEASLEFYSSDMPGKYRIIAEGISTEGKIMFGTTLLNVIVAEK